MNFAVFEYLLLSSLQRIFILKRVRVEGLEGVGAGMVSEYRSFLGLFMR
jgi:hypothetical protein